MSFEEIVESLDDATVLTKSVVLDLYRKFGCRPVSTAVSEPQGSQPASWRERIWTCPDETQLSVTEFGEAAGRRRSWAYDQASHRTAAPVHHDEAGRPYYVAREVRDWLRVRGETVTTTNGRRAR
jgi:hypothetical protein